MSDETQLGENFYDVVDARQPGDAKTNGDAGPILGKDFYADAPPTEKPVHRTPVVDEATAETVHPHFERARLMYGPQEKSGDEADDEAHAAEKSSDRESETDEKPESKVDLKIDLPEGHELDEQRLGQFKTIAGEANIPLGAQQRLLDLFTAGVKQEAEAREQQRQQWEADTRADRELGLHLSTHLRRAKSVLQEYGDDELVGLLNETGLGNHRSVIRLLSAIGRDIKGLVGKL